MVRAALETEMLRAEMARAALETETLRAETARAALIKIETARAVVSIRTETARAAVSIRIEMVRAVALAEEMVAEALIKRRILIHQRSL